MSKPIPCGLCASCKSREDARYPTPEIIPEGKSVDGEFEEKPKWGRNPIVAYLRSEGTTLVKWCKKNHENYYRVQNVIHKYAKNPRIQQKLEDAGLWELLEEE